MAWATFTDIADRLPYVAIAASGTKPTTAQTTTWIKHYEAELKGAMTEANWSLTQTDADATAYLKNLVVSGVCADVLETRMRSIGGASKADKRAATFRATWDAGKEAIGAGNNVIPNGTKVDGGPPDEARPGVSSTFLDEDTIADARELTMGMDW